MGSSPVSMLRPSDSAWPTARLALLGDDAPATLTLRGDPAIWRGNERRLALFCASRAPASLLLATHDLAQRWRQGGPLILSGFHTLIEQEALAVLLRGPRPIILAPAREVAAYRVQRSWRAALDAGRLLLLSPFPDNARRISAATAAVRNRVVAALADEVLIVHAPPGSRTEALAREIVAWGQPVRTLEHAANANLLALGAIPYRPD